MAPTGTKGTIYFQIAPALAIRNKAQSTAQQLYLHLRADDSATPAPSPPVTQ